MSSGARRPAPLPRSASSRTAPASSAGHDAAATRAPRGAGSRVTGLADAATGPRGPGSSRVTRAAPATGPQSGRRTRPLLLSGILAAVIAAGMGLAVLLFLAVAGWTAAPHSGLGLPGVFRAAAALWLVAHHVGFTVRGAGRIGMLPLGLVLLPGALLWRAGKWIIREQSITSLRRAVAAVTSIAVPYAVLAGILAVVSRSSLAVASIPQAVVAAFLTALVAAGLGSVRALAPRAPVGQQMTLRLRSVLAAVAAILALLTAAGAGLTALALAAHLRQFAATDSLLAPGAVGSALLFLIELGYLPNAVIWSIGYLLGPGFAVGAGTIVAPTGSVLGPVPAFPLLTALPQGMHQATPAWLTALVLAVPYLAGIFGGLILVRLRPSPLLEAAPLWGLCCGLAVGAVLGLLSAFAGGPLGDVRLAAVGPSPWQVAAVAALESGIAAAVAAGALNWRLTRDLWAQWSPALDGRGDKARPGPSGTAADPGAAGEPAGTYQPFAQGPHRKVIYQDRWSKPKRPRPQRPGRGPWVRP